MAVLSFAGLILILLLVAVVVVVVALVAVNCRRGSAPPVSSAPSATAAPALSRDDRKAILKRLAQGEITKDQAEEQLGARGNLVPGDMAVPASPPSGGRGCLIALLLGLILVPLIMIVLYLFAGFQVRRSHAGSSSRWRSSHAEMPADLTSDERIQRVLSESLKDQKVILQEIEPSNPNGG